MCKNIRVLYNFDPPVTDTEIQAAAGQFVRKITGFTKPSAGNEEAFNTAIAEIAHTTHHLMAALTTLAPHKNREIEHQKAHQRSLKRFGAA